MSLSDPQFRDRLRNQAIQRALTVKIPLNDLSRRSQTQLEAEITAIRQVLASAHYLKGSFTKSLESTIERRIGKEFVLCIANGTDALKLAFQGLDLKSGDLVAVTANAGGYASTAAKQLNLRVGLVDVDVNTHQMSIDSLKAFLTNNPETKAVVATHLYGQIGYIDEIVSTCRNSGIFIIEDCAQSFGASKHGIESGGFGDVATFSFYPTKNLGAAGDAGAVAFVSEQHFARAMKASQYGWGSRYSVDLAGGFNSRMDEIQAAVLVEREKFVDSENKKRREIAFRFNKSLSGSRKLIGSHDESFVAHLAIVTSESRDDDMARLNSAGIDTGIHYPILDIDQPAWANTFDPSELRNSQEVVNKIFTIPCFPGLTEEEIDYICNALKNL